MTFSQRQGYEEVPAPLRLEELPPIARVRIWNVLYAHLHATKNLSGYIDGPWESILRRLWAWHDNRPLDDWTDSFAVWCDNLRRRVEYEEFNRVFDLIQFIMQDAKCPHTFLTTMSEAFASCQLAYKIDVGPPPTIFPAATPEEGDQLQRNLVELRAAGLDGCTAHLRLSAERVSAEDWAGSIRESIHAVESVAKQVTPDGARTLGAALNSLGKQGVLRHKALKEAFSKLYGYTSDESGIRHALLDEAKAKVTIDEAVFFLGACASFASYLWRKHKAAANTQ